MKQIDKKTTYIVIAAYNEQDRIGTVVKNLIKGGFKNIVVVDDGSKDQTYAVISKLSCISLLHPINRGQGAALKTGIDCALRNGAKYIVTFDADGQHRVQDIDKMVFPVQFGPYDVSLGSRFLDGTTEMPIGRYVTLKVAVLIQ